MHWLPLPAISSNPVLRRSLLIVSTGSTRPIPEPASPAFNHWRIWAPLTPSCFTSAFLGRPFAGHRDSISELIGNIVENAIEDVLCRAGISFRKTGRAERLPGFDQAPDFVVPNEFNPQIVIEAKLTEDDGTARDKVTRVQHLGALSTAGRPSGQPRFEVIACIAGRGFGVRREDMKKLLLATRGKVFTLQNMGQLVENTRLAEFRSR